MKSKILYLVIITIFMVLACSSQKKFNGTIYDKPAKDFCLTGWEEGKERKVCLKDFKGKVVLMFFGYTHCPDVCPTALGVLAKTVGKLEKERDRVVVLFVSVDPERDSPELSQKYLSHFGQNFIGVTGSKEELDRITKDYMAFYRKVKGNSKSGYLVDHTAYIYLIDPEGTLKLIYSSSKQKPDLIADDIKRIL